MFMSFSNFLLWEVYPSIVIHGQCIFITFDSARRERNLSKLIKQKFISATWPQQLTLKNKVIHQQISTYPKWFLVTLKISSLFIMKSLLNVNLYTWSAFISHVACLSKTSNSWYKYSGPFLGQKFCGIHRILNVFKIQFFPVEIIRWQSYFQQWNLDKDINFLNSSIDSKLGFFECWS